MPVEIKSRKGIELSSQDDHMRPDSTMEGLAKLPAAFSKNGCVTAGNASRHRRRRRRAAARVGEGREGARLDAARAADALGDRRRRAGLMGMGPAPATRRCSSGRG